VISVAEALARLFALVAVMPTETTPLAAAAGRVLAQPIRATRPQPPFAASAMDGYAIALADPPAGTRFRVIGEAAAGSAYEGTLAASDAVRIFTGAPVPAGACRVLIQEDVARHGNAIVLRSAPPERSRHIRPAAADFAAGYEVAAPRLLRPADIALLAAMNAAMVPVARAPRVAVIATGDELVMPGQTPQATQIIASGNFGLQALLRQAGAEAELLPIAGDTAPMLKKVLGMAQEADLVLTIGGASVGAHDLVADITAALGMTRSFHRVAMRPGKPLMAGRMASGAMMIGLPGNPVSAMVCGHIFVLPVIRAMLGLPATPAPETMVTLAHDLPANGARQHYMRARIAQGRAHVYEQQDSALLTLLADANGLVVRPPYDGARQAQEPMPCVLI